MNEEQLRARQYILSNKELSPEYGAVIINASSETSISLYICYTSAGYCCRCSFQSLLCPTGASDIL